MICYLYNSAANLIVYATLLHKMSLLSNKKVRSTPFREEVLKVFQANDYAITVAYIEEALGEHDRITLYRTIKTFIDRGLIHEIVMPGDIKKLALCQDCDHSHSHEHPHAHPHNHVHFHCEKCDEISCVDNEMPPITLKGYQVEAIEVQAHGICPKCK
ncbi:MAG: Fur family ferric uptake transcriptional regulator [Parvicellaceae bacterium]|jgi:Fur family ferric uptake transcriptional regulator